MSLPSFLRRVGSKVQIESRESFSQLFSINSDLTYDVQFSEADRVIRGHAPSIAQGALSNVHGSWYEWILGHQFWNTFADNDNSYLVTKLPNITSFDVADLFENKLKGYIVDLRKKVLEASQVELVTSNPDFVIFDVTDT
jgi:hypothetical protein